MIIALALAGIAALAAGAAWLGVQPHPAGQSGAGAVVQPASEAKRKAHREKFFSGDPERDIRGGQEMKPRW
nr:entry exclusion protein TrbK [Sinorhizobium saheli]